MSGFDSIRRHVREHRRGMIFDLVFAVVWVAAVSLLADVLGAPQWASYLLMATGVVAYFGFVWSLSAARNGAVGQERG